MRADELALLHEVYDDILNVMATGRPTGSTEQIADRFRRFLGLPAWPAQETRSEPTADGALTELRQRLGVDARPARICPKCDRPIPDHWQFEICNACPQG